MFEFLITAALAFLFGLIATWLMRDREPIERALLVLILYIPLSLCAITIGTINGAYQQQALTEAVGFHALLAFECNAIAMLINFLSPRPRPKPE